ncbi:hypothetical protein SH139x_000962 [Planctomycetaceae bacterium SH139]
MTLAPSDPPVGHLETQFLFDGDFASSLSQWLGEDMEGAQLSKQFQLFYHVRSYLPIFARQLLQRVRNRRVSPVGDWYLPPGLLAHLAGRPNLTHPVWPNAAPFSLVLTHDVETKEGVEKIDRLAAIEEALGFRSCWNIVPYKYKTDAGLIRSLRERGHEIGIHGYNHDGKLFLNKKTFDARVPLINQAIEELGTVGFRTPMVHRNLSWLQQLNIKYDSSCFDIDPFQAMPGGVQSWWPFRVGKFIELPYTLPQDHTLLVTLGESTDRIWQLKLEEIRRFGGMALVLTHPDYLDSPERLGIYRGFLESIQNEHTPWHALPSEMAKWAANRLGPVTSAVD